MSLETKVEAVKETIWKLFTEAKGKSVKQAYLECYALIKEIQTCEDKIKSELNKTYGKKGGDHIDTD